MFVHANLRNGWTDFDAVFKIYCDSYLDVGNYTTIKTNARVRSCQLSQQNRNELRHRHRFTEVRNKITAFLLVNQHARSTRATRRAFPFLSCRDLLHIRIRFSSASIYADSDADADVEIDADVPHVRMRMRIFATSLV
ncbi:hypothetical protein EVAR_17876_1 [Eumeta japonica]|uniref:Uncharacterized protein n=1 Tax=Eumeta variegata TaxID=151549 RepID=A0A4C1ZLZ1_EUMVA|nr:hypothetical protein EVAR_17876_1 [Eumeta japonica]